MLPRLPDRFSHTPYSPNKQWRHTTSAYKEPRSSGNPEDIQTVYHFWKHAQQFCSTWMTSQMQKKKNPNHGRCKTNDTYIVQQCVYTLFLNNILKFLSFFTFSPALFVFILSPKYQSKTTNPLFFHYAFMTSSR